MSTIAELLGRARVSLAACGVEQPGREAALLLSSTLDMSESALLAHDRRSIAPELAARFDDLIDRRSRREPAAYLLGRREFWGREFAVDDRVLVPRPETEHLVELALSLSLPSMARILDVGTGSGCVAVTLAAERRSWRIVASDLSTAALAVARQNALRLVPDRQIDWVASDLSDALRLDSFDLVLANLPYLDPTRAVELAPELAFEPPDALFAGRSGLALLERLLGQADQLAPGSYLAYEIGGDQSAAVAAAAGRESWDLLATGRDLAGFERNLLWRRRA